jgi:hypothetical protein
MADKKLMQRVKAISQCVNKDRTVVANEFLTELKAKLAARKYRADLKLVTSSRNTEKTFQAEVRFNGMLGHPSEKDLLALTAEKFPNHDINWQLIECDATSGILTLMLEPSKEVIPVKSVKDVPPEFKSVGSCIYKRASNPEESIFEIWSLKNTDDGLALVRNVDDFEMTAEETEHKFKKGDVVLTSYGPGIFSKYDDLGNGFVQVGNKMHLVGSPELQPYHVEDEKTKLKEYFSQIYGKEYSEMLTKDLGKKDKK